MMSEEIDVRNYNELEQSIALAQHIVYKSYLSELDRYPIVKPSSVLLDEKTEDCVRLIQLEELSCKKDEDIFQKLSTVYHASMSLGCNLVVLVDVEKINAPAKIYIGVRNEGENQEKKTNLAISFRTLKNGIKSNFPGTKFRDVSSWDEAPKMMDDILGNTAKYISAVSCVAAARDKTKTENKTFIQGIEKLIDAMQGNTYTAVFIAEPITPEEQSLIRDGYESIYSSLASFRKSTWTYNESESEAVMKSVSEGLSTAITTGTSHTQSNTMNVGINIGMNGTRSDAMSNGHTESNGRTAPTKIARMGQVVSGVAKVAGLVGSFAPICPVLGGAYAVAKIAGVASAVGGMMTGSTQNHTSSDTITQTIGKSLGIGGGLNAGYARTSADTVMNSETNTQTTTKTSSNTNTESSGKSLQIENINKPIDQMLCRIDQLLKRTQECEDYGAYNCAVYFVSGKQDSCMLGANTFRALMIGEGSSIESGAINFWNGATEPEEVNTLKEYIKRFVHPVFARSISGKMDSEEDFMKYTAGTIVSGLELPLHIGFPTKSVYGLPVIEHAEFGKEVAKSTEEEDGREIELGSVLCMGDEISTKVKIDIESLAMHTFITGSTGKGKSTAIYSILDKLMDTNIKDEEEKIKFMVIEPAKGEYKNRFGNCENVRVYGTNAKKTPLLKINPFSFPEDIHVLEHIDRLVEIFNVCWPMYAAMPAVLKDAIERAYVVSGWNLETSECRYANIDGEKLFPSFADVLKQIWVVMDESMYSSDSKGDYKGALCTRLKSLTNGLYGQIFTNDELTSEDLFEHNVIVDLSRIGSSETKSLIMGLLIMKLQEHRMANMQGMNLPLKHVTVLEEAHNILKRTSTEQVNEGANMIGKSVEMLANSIAEMRSYGEGFIIADQAPGLMDLSVIRNTNTKIIFGLPDYDDRELVGKAAGLNENQIAELARLQTFVSAIYQNNWLEPVLCKLDTEFKTIPKYSYQGSGKDEKKFDNYIEFLLTPLNKRMLLEQEYVDNLVNSVYKLPISSESKIAFVEYAKATEKQKIQKLRGQAVYGIFNSEEAFGMAKGKESNIDSWYNFVKDILDPTISLFSEEDQQRIIALITKEKAELDGGEDTVDLFERLISFI